MTRWQRFVRWFWLRLWRETWRVIAACAVYGICAILMHQVLANLAKLTEAMP